MPRRRGLRFLWCGFLQRFRSSRSYEKERGSAASATRRGCAASGVFGFSGDEMRERRAATHRVALRTSVWIAALWLKKSPCWTQHKDRLTIAARYTSHLASIV